MQKRILLTLLVMLAFLAAQAETIHEVEYFYENLCEACDPEADFAGQFKLLTGLNLDDCHFRGYNVARESGKARLAEALEELGLETSVIPLIIVDGVAYQGAGELSDRLPETALSWKPTNDSAIVYLYVPACESCARVADVLDALAESVTVQRGNLTFDSRVTIEKIDASRNMPLADAMFEAYSVPDEDRVAPIVFFADHYLAGADAIEQRLAAMVNLGWAVGGTEINQQTISSDSSARSLWGTLGAGLVGGLNTCALSMLLLFLSILLETRAHVVSLTVAFLSAKFICYLLIGFALMGLLQQLNPNWLRPLARWLMTVIGATLILLNLWDAQRLLLKRRGKLHNQLPSTLRKRLGQTIRTLTQKRFLLPAVIALGFIVALGEFLCAGQMYLLRLLSAFQAGETRLTANICLYCAAFISPSALLCALVLTGRSRMEVSGFLARHMAAVKIITALMMLLLIVAAWGL